MTTALKQLFRKPIAHRGLHDRIVPENSMGAFNMAMQWSLPIELDVRLLADGHVAVIHDNCLLRMTGKEIFVSTSTARDLRALTLLETKQTIPLLEDVLEQVAGKVPLLIELKDFRPRVGALESRVLALLREYSGEYALQSFNIFSLLWLKRFSPAIPYGQLSFGRYGVPFHWLTCPHFIAHNLAALPNRPITRLRKRNIPLLAWTISTCVQLDKARCVADNWIFDASDELRKEMQLFTCNQENEPF